MFDKRWSNEDLSLLKEKYKLLDFDELCIRLNRTTHAVRWKAKQLKITIPKVDYSKEEDRFILSNSKKITVKEMAESLNRTEASVRKRLSKIRVRKLSNFNRTISPLEKGIPINESISGSYRFMLAELDLGDSFIYPKKNHQSVINQYCFFPKRKFLTKKIEGGGNRRVWRIQ